MSGYLNAAVVLVAVASTVNAQSQPASTESTRTTATTRPTLSEVAATRPASPPANATASTPPSADFNAKYAVVAERNMFLRDRVRRPADGATTRPANNSATASQSLEELLVLRGIVLEDDSFRAYFENSRTNEVVRVGSGEALARGHVIDLSIDAVQFEGERGLLWISIGDNLVGAHVGSSGTRAAAGPATSSSGGTGDGGNLSVEERMRLRRQQSSGGAPR